MRHYATNHDIRQSRHRQEITTMFFDDAIKSNIFWMHKNDLTALRQIAHKNNAEVKHRPFKRGALSELAATVIFNGHSWKAKMEAKAAFWQEIKSSGLNIQS